MSFEAEAFAEWFGEALSSFVITVGMMTPLGEDFFAGLPVVVPWVMTGDSFTHLQGQGMLVLWRLVSPFDAFDVAF